MLISVGVRGGCVGVTAVMDAGTGDISISCISRRKQIVLDTFNVTNEHAAAMSHHNMRHR